jgi:hypothetical protein
MKAVFFTACLFLGISAFVLAAEEGRGSEIQAVEVKIPAEASPALPGEPEAPPPAETVKVGAVLPEGKRPPSKGRWVRQASKPAEETVVIRYGIDGLPVEEVREVKPIPPEQFPSKEEAGQSEKS